MCTATLIPLSRGLCLTTNRDEGRERPPALPPMVRSFPGGVLGVYPTDPQGAGTWVGANNAGLVLTLLNLNVTPADADVPPRSPALLRSRGLIIPALLPSRTLTEAADRLTAFDLREFGPFRLLLSAGDGVAITSSDGGSARATVRRLALGPLMLASSGLGDERVAGPRQRLFADMVLADWPAADDSVRLHRQERFHRHRWAESPQLSVCMSRRDARTVSRTTVRVGVDGVRLSYCDVNETAGDGVLVEMSLPKGSF
jgi:hypothetical protein